MKITPIEIRQKNFERVFRGYDKEEVDAFLQSLSQEWERVVDENKENRIKLEMAEKEVRKLREVENSLFRTLKTAEDTGSHLIEQANRSAELYLREAKAHADALLREARGKAQQLLQEAEMRSKRVLEETITELKSLEKDFRQLENQKDNFVLEIKSMANDTLEKVNRIAARGNTFTFDTKINEVKELLERKNDLSLPSVQEMTESFSNGNALSVNTPAGPSVPTPKKNEENPGNASGSFFDEIRG